jgi:hypothetical protein
MKDEQPNSILASRELDADVHHALHPKHRIWPSNDPKRWRYCDADHKAQHQCRWHPLPYYSTEMGLDACREILNAAKEKARQ